MFSKRILRSRGLSERHSLVRFVSFHEPSKGGRVTVPTLVSLCLATLPQIPSITVTGHESQRHRNEYVDLTYSPWPIPPGHHRVDVECAFAASENSEQATGVGGVALGAIHVHRHQLRVRIDGHHLA